MDGIKKKHQLNKKKKVESVASINGAKGMASVRERHRITFFHLVRASGMCIKCSWRCCECVYIYAVHSHSHWLYAVCLPIFSFIFFALIKSICCGFHSAVRSFAWAFILEHSVSGSLFRAFFARVLCCLSLFLCLCVSVSLYLSPFSPFSAETRRLRTRIEQKAHEQKKTTTTATTTAAVAAATSVSFSLNATLHTQYLARALSLMYLIRRRYGTMLRIYSALCAELNHKPDIHLEAHQ